MEGLRLRLRFVRARVHKGNADLDQALARPSLKTSLKPLIFSPNDVTMKNSGDFG